MAIRLDLLHSAKSRLGSIPKQGDQATERAIEALEECISQLKKGNTQEPLLRHTLIMLREWSRNCYEEINAWERMGDDTTVAKHYEAAADNVAEFLEYW